MTSLAKENIESRPIWKPMSLQPFYAECPVFSHEEGKRCVGWTVFEQGLCLPSDVNMSDADVARVSELIVRNFA